jgi:RimJ/RimL family protein N-acetyltransferase
VNPLGQPVGPALPEWRPPARPQHAVLRGRYCRVEPLSAMRHAAELYAANSLDRDGRMWTYLFSGPFATLEEYTTWLEARENSTDPLFFAVIDGASGKATGIASYLRIDTTHGVMEVGHLAFSPLLQRTRTATEAMYLMMKQAFELGYRRYEWKCDALNAPSRCAAERLGFTFEGVFRQAVVYKGRSRDTAWYSVLDREWPARKAAFVAWLDPENFEPDGRQLQSLRGGK